MISSMTGYGRCESSCNGRKVVVEINSVNHRYLDLNLRMPKSLMYLDDKLRQIVKNTITRGKVEITISYQSTSKEDLQITVNEALGEAYIKGLRKFAEKNGIEDDLKLSDLMSVSDFVSIEKKNGNEEELENLITDALENALSQFAIMRQKEGSNLAKDLLDKTSNLQVMVNAIDKLSPMVAVSYKDKLTARIEELIDKIPVDEARIAMEVALFADKCSIDEELTRLKSHISQLMETLTSGTVVGRKLDFLLQEMNRETNTIGSKANDYEITKLVISLKAEMEKIREQVQNIE